MSTTQTTEKAEAHTAEDVSRKTFVRYVDMTPTWIGILPILLETKDRPDSAKELEKMAKLADRLNTPLHKASPDLLEACKKARTCASLPDSIYELLRVAISKAEKGAQ